MIKKITWILLGSVTVLLWRCTDNGEAAKVDLDEAAFLKNMGEQIITPAYEDLLDHTQSLMTAVDAFIAKPEQATLNALREALKNTRSSWQGAALFDFGPASDLTLTAQYNIYPVDANQIQKNIESGTYDLATISNNDAKGLPGIAYLIHPREIADEQVLAHFTNDDRAANRQQYLKDITANMLTAIQNVHTQWIDTYLARFTSPSSYGTSTGSSTSQLFNTMVRSFERRTRDGKIGIPTGIRSLGQIIPTSTEAYYGGYSAELAAANIRQYQLTFSGNGATAFDDYLEAYGKKDLAEEIDAKFSALIKQVQSLKDPLAEQIETDKKPAEATFVSMQELVNLLKTDVASQLNISITYTDNDGD